MEFKKENGGRGVQMFQLNFTATGEVFNGIGEYPGVVSHWVKKNHLPFFFPFLKRPGLKLVLDSKRFF